MGSRTDRLKAMISATSFIPLPQRPGIHTDAQKAVAALLGMHGLDKTGPELRA